MTSVDFVFSKKVLSCGISFFSKVLISFIFQADQLVSEKVSGAEHTKLDDNFVQMEKITDVFLEVEVSAFQSVGLGIKYLSEL